MSTPVYTPTLAQIRAACRKIQETWSPEEEQRRKAVRDRPVEWTPPEVRESRDE